MRDAPGHDARGRREPASPSGDSGAVSTGSRPEEPRAPTYGSYRIVGSLGRGGVGAVYIGEHVLIGKRVAIKVLLPELSRSREVVARFFHEARSAASILDPGIVEVFDFGYDPHGNAYIAMELLQGENLAARLGSRPRPSLAFLTYVGRQIARSVGAAHAQHIVHRDLKPDNVFLADDPDLPFSARVKVLDFGMAKLTGENGPQTVITEKGALLGTPMYMAPEQCRGLGEIDGRADVYALGCMLYEMACGHPPFVSGGVGVIIGSHMYVPVPRPRDLVPELPEALEQILLRCLAKSPAERYPTMDELSRDLAQLAAEHVRAPRASL